MGEINIDRFQELLGKLNIPLYEAVDYNKTGNRVKTMRNTFDVLRDLSQFWDVVSKDYKREIYKSIGLPNVVLAKPYINDTDC